MMARGLSAREPNRKVCEACAEERVHRIDHHPGKEAAQSILTLRFSNAIFEPLWICNCINRMPGPAQAEQLLAVNGTEWYRDCGLREAGCNSRGVG